MKKQTKTDMYYTRLLNTLSTEDIFLVRKNRNWSDFDMASPKEKKEIFIQECRYTLGDISLIVEQDEPTYKLISEQGIVLFGAFKGKEIFKMPNSNKLWYISNVDGFKQELKRMTNEENI